MTAGATAPVHSLPQILPNLIVLTFQSDVTLQPPPTPPPTDLLEPGNQAQSAPEDPSPPPLDAIPVLSCDSSVTLGAPEIVGRNADGTFQGFITLEEVSTTCDAPVQRISVLADICWEALQCGGTDHQAWGVRETECFVIRTSPDDPGACSTHAVGGITVPCGGVDDVVATLRNPEWPNGGPQRPCEGDWYSPGRHFVTIGYRNPSFPIIDYQPRSGCEQQSGSLQDPTRINPVTVKCYTNDEVEFPGV